MRHASLADRRWQEVRLNPGTGRGADAVLMREHPDAGEVVDLHEQFEAARRSPDLTDSTKDTRDQPSQPASPRISRCCGGPVPVRQARPARPQPRQVVLGQLAFGALVLLILVAIRRQSLPQVSRDWAYLAGMAVLANIAPYLLFSWSEQRISSGLAGVLSGTTPLLTCSSPGRSASAV